MDRRWFFLPVMFLGSFALGYGGEKLGDAEERLANLQAQIEAMAKREKEQAKLIEEMRRQMESLAQREQNSSKLVIDLRQEMEAMRTAADEEIRGLRQASAGGAPESLVSFRKNGNVRIGGEAKFSYNVVRRARQDNTHIKDDCIGWQTEDSNLLFQVDITEKTGATFKLNLTGDPAVEEMYLAWREIANSKLTIHLGLKEAPFGMSDGGVAISDPYSHGTWSFKVSPASYFAASYPGDSSWGTIPPGVDPRQALSESPSGWQGTVGPALGLELVYEFLKDKLKWEAMVFQNTARDDECNGMGIWGGVPTGSQHFFENGYSNTFGDGKTDDTGFRSFATRITWNPLESLLLQLSFANHHNDRMGQEGYWIQGLGRDESTATPSWQYVTPIWVPRWGTPVPGYYWNEWAYYGHPLLYPDPYQDLLTANLAVSKNRVSDQQTLSFGYSYKLKELPLRFYGEYLRGWNVNYLDSSYSNVFSLGTDVYVNKNLTVTMLGEHANMRFPGKAVPVTSGDLNRTNTTHYAIIDHESLWRALIAAQYTFDSGFFLSAEYGHEWYRRTGEHDVKKNTREADAVIFASGITF